jgi:hypothetical protein
VAREEAELLGLVVPEAHSFVHRTIQLLAVVCTLLLSNGCGDSIERGTSVEVVLEPALSPGTGARFDVWAGQGGGWYANTVIPSTAILMERTELWVSQDSSGVHARARVSRYEESAAVSGVERDEASSLHGSIRLSGADLPIDGRRVSVAYELDGQRDGEAIHRAGAFEFGPSDLKR